jgi:HK97 family phage portal protein
MKLKLPLIGDVRLGKDAQPVEVVREVKGKEKFFDLLGGMIDLGPNRLSNEKTISTKILQSNKGWVYRNNDAIAKEVSKIEFELYTVGLSAGQIVYNEVETHPLLDLLDKPNEETSKGDAMYIIQSHRKLTGDAFWLKLRTNGVTTALRSLPPDKIMLNLRPPTPEDPTVIESFHYQDTIDGNKIDVNYDPKDIIHFKIPNPNNAFRGLGAVEAMADTIDIDNLIENTAKKFFENGALSNLVFSTDAKVTDEQLKRFRAEFKSTFGGSNNAFKAMVLGNGLKPSDISYSNKDMQFLDQLEWYRDKIMAGFGNTKASLGMIDDVNRASHEGSIIEWQRNTVKPDMQAIVDTLNEFLVPEFGQNLVLGFCDPVPEDRADDIAEVKDLYPIGVMTLNEARENVDLEAVDNGNEFYSPPVAPQPGIINPDDEAVDQEFEDD